MAIIDRATLRTNIADWLNRTDLTDTQLDLFIQMAEAKVYEELRVPPLEALKGFSVVESNSSIIIPSGFLELIELRLVKAGTCSVDPTTNTTRALCVAASGTWSDADKDDDISYRRIDGKAFHNNQMNYAFTRELDNFLLTDKEGKQSASGEYVLKYYKAGDPIGNTSSTATTAGSFVVGKYYTILTVGTTDYTTIGASANTVGVIFAATGVGTGTGTANIEEIPWILSSEYETVLYSSLAVGSAFLGSVEDEARYYQMFLDKITTLNDKAKEAELKGAIFTQIYSEALI